MKKLLLLLAIVGFFVQAQAQTQPQKLLAKDVPTAVTSSFHNDYQSVKDVDWSKDGINYAAEYSNDNVSRSVTYDAKGTLVESKMAITVSALPTLAAEYVKNNFIGEEIKEASKIIDASNVVTYEAQVKGMSLIFDSKGNFIKSFQD